jgi:hypothetical protein
LVFIIGRTIDASTNRVNRWPSDFAVARDALDPIPGRSGCAQLLHEKL